MDNIDDDELQELADANMDIHDSQQQPVQAHQQHENQSKPAAHQEDPTAGQQQAQQGISSHSKTSDDNIHLPEEDVMLDDDELIELACASLSEDISKAPEQDCKADEHSCIGDVPLADTLDDEELLALATTQLDEA